MEKENILYLGQKEIGEQCFGILFDMYKNKKINLVVSSNISENVWWRKNNIYKVCMENNIPFFSNENKDEMIINEYIIKYQCTMIISVQHNLILSRKTLQLVNYKAFNLHLAKLPEYQGYCSYNHAILNGDQYYGVTLHWMTEKVDFGEIAYYKEFDITINDTAYSLYVKSVNTGIEIFKEFISGLYKGYIPKIVMKGTPGFYKRKSIETWKEIRNFDDESQVDRIIRACYFPPFDGAYINICGKKVFLIPQS